jgi:hypothetical protein
VPSGAGQVCLGYSDGDVTGNESSLKVFSRNAGEWVDVTTTVNSETNTACGSATLPTTLLLAEKTSCCVARVGDANGDGSDEPTIGDVSVMIDAKFLAGSCDGLLNCLGEADVNLSGGSNPTCDDITIGDISNLVDYLFITGASLGLPDCF